MIWLNNLETIFIIPQPFIQVFLIVFLIVLGLPFFLLILLLLFFLLIPRSLSYFFREIAQRKPFPLAFTFIVSALGKIIAIGKHAAVFGQPDIVAAESLRPYALLRRYLSPGALFG